MKVLFLEHVVNVGRKWEIKEVTDAYARNFLIPKKLAQKVTDDMLKKMKADEKKKESDRRNLVHNKTDIIQQLHGQHIVFKKKVWRNDKIFWNITEKDIISEIEKKFHIFLSKKHIAFPNGHIKKLGEDFVYIQLWENDSAKINISVTPL